MKILRLWDVDEGENATIGYCTIPPEGVEAVSEAIQDLDLRVEVIEVKEVLTAEGILEWLGEADEG